MSGLPGGWVETHLENLVDILDSRRVPLNADERERRINGKHQDELYPYYGATGAVGFIDDYLFDEPLILLGEDGVPFFDAFRTKAYQIFGKSWVNNHAHVLRSRKEVADQRYLSAYLNSFDYTGYVSGSTRLKLTQASMRGIPISLPPLAEQKRIADKLDALLARVDRARARLDRVPLILKRFRQAVLAAATSGQLTEDWREERGDEIYWETVTLEQVAQAISDGPFGSNLKTDDYTDTGVRVVRLENIGHLKFLDAKQTFISEKKYLSLQKYTLSPKDIIFSSFVDEDVRTCLLPESIGIAINKADCFCIRANTGACLPEYLVARLASRVTFTDLQELVHGATRPRVNLTQIKKLEFDLPSLVEQHEIVRRVEILFTFADHLEARYQAARSQVEQLTPALLAQAFRGELVPQDPNDEPAVVLLERLKAVPATLTPETDKKSRRSTIRMKVTHKHAFGGQEDIAQVLRLAGKELSTKDLLAAAGYPADANSELIEKFLVGIREAIKKQEISRQRRDDQDWFSLAK